MQDSLPILQVKDLVTKLQESGHLVKVVDGLSFDLHAGKTLALVGESGCGKTMTALSLLSILPEPPALPAEGEVLFDGKNLLLLKEKELRSLRGSKISMVFQNPSSALNPVYTIGYQVREVVEIHLGLEEEEINKKAIQAMVEVGIADPEQILDVYPHQLSGGMKQRVMLAMALLCEPTILIADEPTTALDVTIQAQVLDLIRALQKRKQMAVLLITHDMGVVAEIADYVIVMYAAKSVETGTVEEIFDNPSHPYTLGLFQSRPSLDESKNKLTPIRGSVPTPSHFPAGCRFHPRCPYAMEKCHHGIVPEFAIDDSLTHRAACWLWDGTEESEQQKRRFGWKITPLS